MCRKIDIVKVKWIMWRGWPALLLLLGGCASDGRMSLVSLDRAFGAPFLKTEQRVPVVYPAEEVRQGGGLPLVEAYGPAWQDLHGSYPEYQFN